MMGSGEFSGRVGLVRVEWSGQQQGETAGPFASLRDDKTKGQATATAKGSGNLNC
jgi:hypothetical protein